MTEVVKTRHSVAFWRESNLRPWIREHRAFCYAIVTVLLLLLMVI